MGSCKKCMALSFALTIVSVVSLFLGFTLDSTPLLLLSAIGLGGFGSLFAVHVTFYLLRRTGVLELAPSTKPCCQ